MSIFKPFVNAINWLGQAFKTVKNDGAKVAVSITQGVKAALDSGVVGFLASVVEEILPATHDIPTQVVALINKEIPKVLAVELAVQGLPDNPTPDDILAFEKAVLAAFGVTSDKSKLYTELGAQIYGIIQRDAQSGVKFTFAKLVEDVDAAWEAYQKDLADSQAQLAAA